MLHKFNEKVIWQGKSNSNLVTTLTFNSSTETWSLIIADKEFACILDAGEGFVIAAQSGSTPAPKPQTDRKKDSKNLIDISFDQ